MPHATDNNGGQPVTQQTRDTMAQNDHDQLVRLTVMMQTIMDGQARMEQQIKDVITTQAAALASWETQSKIDSQAQDIRIRAIEDLASRYVPMVDTITGDITKLKIDVQLFKDNDNKFLGGWKILVFIGGILAGVIGLIISLIDIIVHAPK